MFSQTITKQVIGSNGTTQSSDNITSSYTIGEPVVGLMYNENNQLSNGFHSGLNLNSVQFYTTQLQYSQCNSTLNSLTSPIVADLVEGAESYRFEITNGSNVQTFITTTIDQGRPRSQGRNAQNPDSISAWFQESYS